MKLAAIVGCVVLLARVAAAQESLAPDLAAKLEAAQRGLDDDRFDDARALLEGLFAQKEPAEKPTRLLELLADARWRSGDLEAAGELYATAHEQRPKSRRALIGLARLALARGDGDTALQLSESAVTASPNEPEPWLLQCAALMKANRVAEAVAARQRADALLAKARAAGIAEPRRVRAALDVVRIAGLGEVTVQRREYVTRLGYDVRAGVPVIGATLRGADGREVAVPLVVDTGGSYFLTLDDSLGEALGLSLAPAGPVEGVEHGATESSYSTVPSMDVGGWTVNAAPALLYPVPSEPALRQRAEPPYRGVLGTAMLQRRILTFLPKMHLIRLMTGRMGQAALVEEEAKRATAVPFFLIGDGKIALHAEVGGKRVLALLDSGAASTALSARLARELAPPNATPAPAPAPLQVRLEGCAIAIADSFAAAPVRATLDERVSPRLGVEVALLLGMDFIARCDRLVVDYVHQQLLVVPEGGEK